jgi:hypothetical protein
VALELLLTIVKNVEVANMNIYIAVVIVNGAMTNVSLGVSFYLSNQIFTGSNGQYHCQTKCSTEFFI